MDMKSMAARTAAAIGRMGLSGELVQNNLIEHNPYGHRKHPHREGLIRRVAP